MVALPTFGAQAAHDDDSVYELVRMELDWNSANAAARRMAADGCRMAHLATITSDAEQLILEGLIAGSDRNAWLGGHQGGLTLEGNWRWITGEKWDEEHWSELEPNDTPFGDYVPGSEQHLEALLGSEDPPRDPGEWNDAPVLRRSTSSSNQSTAAKTTTTESTNMHRPGQARPGEKRMSVCGGGSKLHASPRQSGR